MGITFQVKDMDIIYRLVNKVSELFPSLPEFGLLKAMLMKPCSTICWEIMFLKMESLQTKIEDLDKWRNMEKSVLSGLSTIKDYDIRLHTLATNECQELASMFEERARHSLAEMMNVYEKSIQDVHKYLQWPDINF